MTWNPTLKKLPASKGLEGCQDRYCVANEDESIGFVFVLDQLASPIMGVYLTCEDLGIYKLRLDGIDRRHPDVRRQALEALRYEAYVQIKRLERFRKATESGGQFLE